MKMTNAIKKLEKAGYNVNQIRNENLWVAQREGCTAIKLYKSNSADDLAAIDVGIVHVLSLRDAVTVSQRR